MQTKGVAHPARIDGGSAHNRAPGAVQPAGQGREGDPKFRIWLVVQHAFVVHHVLSLHLPEAAGPVHHFAFYMPRRLVTSGPPLKTDAAAPRPAAVPP